MTDTVIAQLRQENTRLRAALAVSKSPCLYCQLPADEMAKCRPGFHGCDRADDLMGCPELGARLEVEDLKKALAIKTILAALDPAGLVVVRKEPTHEMWTEGCAAWNANRCVNAVYRAMIEASN